MIFYSKFQNKKQSDQATSPGKKSATPAPVGEIRKQGRRLPATVQRSFVDVLCQPGRKQGERFLFALQGSVERDGCPVVKFKELEWRKLAEKDEELLLVGRFMQNRPPIDVIRSAFQCLILVGGATHVGAIDTRIILLRFAVKEDCQRVFSRGQMTVEGRTLRFARWTPDWRKRRSSPIVPIWIQLLDLPLHLLNFDCLAHVCALIGKCLDLDAPTLKRTRPGVARVRIEVDLRQKRIEKVRLEIWNEDGNVFGFWQKVVYESLPDLYSTCGIVGHVAAKCRRSGR